MDDESESVVAVEFNVVVYQRDFYCCIHFCIKTRFDETLCFQPLSVRCALTGGHDARLALASGARTQLARFFSAHSSSWCLFTAFLVRRLLRVEKLIKPLSRVLC